MEEELPSASNIAKEDDVELEEITEITVKSMEDLIAQLNDQTHPLSDLLQHPLH